MAASNARRSRTRAVNAALLGRFGPDATSDLLSADQAAESEVAGGGVHRLRHARCRAVAQAVVRCAEIRPALHHPARDADLGVARVDALLGVTAAWVVEGAAG